MGNGITRAGVTSAKALAIAEIGAMLAACDPDRAAEIAVARMAAGDRLEESLVRALVPQLLDVPVACALIGGLDDGARARLVDLIEKFPEFNDALPMQVMVLWTAWRAGAEKRQLVIAARRLARRKLDTTEKILLGHIAGAIGDANLLALTKKMKASDAVAKPLVSEANKLLVAPIAQVIKELPAAVEASKSNGFTVRSAPRVGRNEPCPCGSGQKYKKCCESKDAAIEASPIAGMSWDAYLTEGAAKMTTENVEALSMFDLARVDRTKLPTLLLVVAFRRFAREMYYARATDMLDELGGRGDSPGPIDDYRDELLAFALSRGEIAIAKQQLAAMETIDPLRATAVALAEREPGALDGALKLAEVAVGKETNVDAVELALVLLESHPALGILVARGCLGETTHVLDAETLLEEIENARDVLGLPPGDPAWDRLKEEPADDAAAAAEQPAAAAARAEAVALHGSLRETSARVAQLERELATKQGELADRERAAAAAAAAPADPAQVKALKRKIEELEGLVREGNTERAELRRQLALAPVAPVAVASAAPEPEEDDGDAVEDIARDIAIPAFSRRALDALDDVPRAVAAETMRTVGALAAGDLAAWRRAKTARDMSRQVLMSRVGIHHRLLFRAEDGPLEIIDLITREELLTTLKKLRANKG